MLLLLLKTCGAVALALLLLFLIYLLGATVYAIVKTLKRELKGGDHIDRTKP